MEWRLGNYRLKDNTSKEKVKNQYRTLFFFVKWPVAQGLGEKVMEHNHGVVFWSMV